MEDDLPALDKLIPVETSFIKVKYTLLYMYLYIKLQIWLDLYLSISISVYLSGGDRKNVTPLLTAVAVCL